MAGLAVGAVLVAGCMQPRPPAVVAQPPSSPRIAALRREALRQIRMWYPGPPRHVAANFEAADRFFDDGDIRGARAAYRRIIGWFSAGPHRRVAEFWIAYCDELLGDRAEAIRLYRKLLANAPEGRELWATEAAARLELLTARPR